jgi:CheY-like chemotaxis protein
MRTDNDIMHSQRVINGFAPPTRALHVLAVDDVAMNCDIAAYFLRSAGHKVICLDGGRAAVAAVEKTDFGVVLMDVRMPDMDGLAATRCIRALTGPRAQVPIVALTAYAFEDQAAECQEAGMNGHVSKPFDAETLVRLPSGRPRQATKAIFLTACQSPKPPP